MLHIWGHVKSPPSWLCETLPLSVSCLFASTYIVLATLIVAKLRVCRPPFVSFSLFISAYFLPPCLRRSSLCTAFISLLLSVCLCSVHFTSGGPSSPQPPTCLHRPASRSYSSTALEKAVRKWRPRSQLSYLVLSIWHNALTSLRNIYIYIYILIYPSVFLSNISLNYTFHTFIKF